MLTVLAMIGRAVAPFLLSLVPGASPKLIMYVAAAFAALVVIGGPAGAVWIHMRAERSAAVASERAACELSKEESARISAETMAQLLDRIAKAETDDDAGKTAKELCASSPFCRNRSKQ